jgi:adenosylcobinamide-GDP ribazoletransferase
MPHGLRLYLVALQFLTRVPVPASLGFEPAWLHQSARHFPGVGLLVGAFSAAVLWGGAHLFSALIAVLLAMAATVWLTGAFHEDGLADTADALGGHVSKERALAIMKDSRIGTYGAVALLGVLALKAAALHSVAARDIVMALLALPLLHAWSRAVPVLLLRWLTYAGDAEHAKAKPMAQQVGAAELWGALMWCALSAVLAWAAGLAVSALLWLALSGLAAALWMGRCLQRRLGGYTGDGLGASQQLSELAMWLCLSALLAQGVVR